MDTITEIVGSIGKFIEEHKYLVERSGDTINTKSLDQRQLLISQLGSINEALTGSLSRLRLFSDAISKVQSEEVAALDSILGRVKKQPDRISPVKIATKTVIRPTDVVVAPPKKLLDQPWTLVQRKPRPVDIIKTERVPSKSLQTLEGFERVKITEEITLMAIPVKTFNEVKCDGCLYYVTSAAHFAVQINGHMLHGNIGIIYTDTEDPQKIKDCRFTEGCNRMSTCRYYHDPAMFPGSKDRRNYIASSFIYSSPSDYRNRARARHFGSLDYLDSDILAVAEEEKARIFDQAMHDLLCALVLKALEPVRK